MECCGLMGAEWCLTLSTTSRVPKPVYEALFGTLYSDLVFKEGNEWKFGTGTRNVNHMGSAFSIGEMLPGGIDTHDAEAKRPQGLL